LKGKGKKEKGGSEEKGRRTSGNSYTLFRRGIDYFQLCSYTEKRKEKEKNKEY